MSLTRKLKISSKDLIKFLKVNDFHIYQMNGSHSVLIQANSGIQLQIPTRKELGRVTLEDALDRAHLTMTKFFDFLGYSKSRP
jgi:predicted RNA binding protein YcfA (HicA-like mRNA interferase family)